MGISLENRGGTLSPTRQYLLNILPLIPTVVATYSTIGNTAAVTNAINYTPPAVAGTYRVSAVLNMTAWTTPASFNITCAYKDASGNARTENLGVYASGGSAIGAAVNAVNRWFVIQSVLQIDNSATAITVSTSGTFTGSPVYNLAAVLEQLA